MRRRCHRRREWERLLGWWRRADIGSEGDKFEGVIFIIESDLNRRGKKRRDKMRVREEWGIRRETEN